MVHTILKFLVVGDSEYSAQLQPAKPVCAAYCCHISFPVSESTLPPAVLNILSLAAVQSQSALIGWRKLWSSTIGLLFAAGPTPARLWNGVEQWRKRGSKVCEYFWPRYVPPAFRV